MKDWTGNTKSIFTTNWYEGHFNPSTARGYKYKLEHNKEITDDKVKVILKTLGIKPKQREVW